MLPALLVAVLLLAVLVVVGAVWVMGGRRWLTGSALLCAPLYMLWKLPIYFNFFRNRETTWRRTPRNME